MSDGARILIVDDDLDMLHLMGVRLSAAGYQVSSAESGEAALISFRRNRPQMVVTDLRMGEMDGLALFDHLQAEAPTMPVIILTAHGTIPDAVAATRRGVFSFLTKPFDGQELMRRVADAIHLSPILDPNQISAQWRKDFITSSVRMEDLLRQTLRISAESRTALFVGPSGSGKTALARAMQQAGHRAGEPFVCFVYRVSGNCAGGKADSWQFRQCLRTGHWRRTLSARYRCLVAHRPSPVVFCPFCPDAGQGSLEPTDVGDPTKRRSRYTDNCLQPTTT